MALCKGIPPATDYSRKGPVMWALILFDASLNKRLNKQSSCGDLKRHDAHVPSL